MRKYKNGFTLAEAIITLGVISAMIAVLTPILRGAFPNKSMVTLKKDFLFN